ncbi:phosphopyruvate hydratase [Candidatus Microgenomates bacterium]|nr:phosphopyruvate hydratase [Candidatus Microgenomates bacterium]
MSKISRVWSREILDSRGNPTVETAVQLDDGVVAVASVPSGASTGKFEAHELRDGDVSRYLGRGVLKAVKNVNQIIGPAVSGLDPSDQAGLDKKLIDLDGSANKEKLGANSILSISLAALRAAATAQRLGLYTWVANLSQKFEIAANVHVPAPIFNMINGGLHGAGNLDFQEFFVIPASSTPYNEGLENSVVIYHKLKENLARKGAIHSVGDEGGYAPNLFTNVDALSIIVETIKDSGFTIGRDLFLGLDVAASTFYKDGKYSVRDRSTPLDTDGMITLYGSLYDQYHLAILEDPLYEDDWEGWAKLTQAFGEKSLIVGDDLLVTNAERVSRGIKEKAANSILVKPNQIGTISQMLQVVKMARDAGWRVIVSHRSGETNDTTIADIAVGIGADYVKFGAPARGERVAKYNRLLTIEAELAVVQK